MPVEPTPRDAADAFVARWRRAGGSERASSPLFVGELCVLPGLAAPQPAQGDERDDAYVLALGRARPVLGEAADQPARWAAT